MTLSLKAPIAKAKLPSVESLAPGYIKSWQTMQVRSRSIAEADKYAKLMSRTYKTTLMRVQAASNVPWWWIGCALYRESNLNFSTYLGNGQTLYKVTTIVPKGRGPWNNFDEGAIDALKYQRYYGAKNWDLVAACYRWERFNGFGYRWRGINTPYLYAGSTAYGPPEARGGLFVSDGKFNGNEVDKRLGTVTLLKRLIQIDRSVIITLPT